MALHESLLVHDMHNEMHFPVTNPAELTALPFEVSRFFGSDDDICHLTFFHNAFNAEFRHHRLCSTSSEVSSSFTVSSFLSVISAGSNANFLA